MHNRPTLMAIHGSASSGKQWQSLRDMAEPSFAVITPTVPDCDGAGRLAYMRALAASCPGDVHLVAHSFGAAIALKLADEIPDRISSVTLYDPVTPVKSNGQMGPAPQLEALFIEMKQLSAKHAMARFLDFWAGHGSWAASAPRKRDALIARHRSVINDIEQIRAGAWTPSSMAYDGPLTLLHGGKSPAVMRVIVDFLTHHYPSVTSRLLPECDHITPLSHAAITDELLLNSVLSQTSVARRHLAA